MDLIIRWLPELIFPFYVATVVKKLIERSRRMKTCLITGSNGFIGRYLTKALQSLDFRVVGVPRALLYKPVELKTFIHKHHPSFILHFASYGNKYDQQEDIKIINANIVTTVNLLYATKNTPYLGFIHCGSSSEYGTKMKPMKETDSLDTDTFYGASKASASLICRAFAKKYDKPVVTVRPFSVYGKDDDSNKFIQTAIRAFELDERMELAPGVHDWIEVSDFVQGVLTVMLHAKELQGKAVNIGTGEQTSNHGVISLLKDIYGKPGNIKHVGRMREYDTSVSWVADNELLSSFGWYPRFNLENGLRSLIYDKK
jgi:nucleoside-diphosphate-sugar epimerase